MPEIFGSDAFSPKEIARKIESVGVVKARLPFVPMLMLGVLAGAFIGLGGMYYVLIRADGSLSFAVAAVMGGAAFSLGLLLVIVAGAELFTGNNLLVMAWADKQISSAELVRNWTIVFIGNAIGAVGVAVLVYLAGHTTLNYLAVGDTYVKIAAAKCALPFWIAFTRGILCNVLVCLAVWMATAGRTVVDKAVAVVFPISAFVAAGFEHSVANMYFFPVALLVQASRTLDKGPDLVTWSGIVSNMVPVTLGNIVGGGVLVGLVYHFVYQRAPQLDARD
jgi:formate/nitrite transporter